MIKINMGLKFEYQDNKKFSVSRVAEDKVLLQWESWNGSCRTVNEIVLTHTSAMVAGEVLTDFFAQLIPQLAAEKAAETAAADDN